MGLSGSCLYFSNTPRASEKQQQSMAPGPASGRGVRWRARQLRLLLPSVRNGSTPIGSVQVFLNFGLNNTLICLGTMWERSRMLAPGSSLLDFSFPKIQVKKRMLKFCAAFGKKKKKMNLTASEIQSPVLSHPCSSIPAGHLGDSLFSPPQALPYSSPLCHAYRDTAGRGFHLAGLAEHLGSL